MKDVFDVKSSVSVSSCVDRVALRNAASRCACVDLPTRVMRLKAGERVEVDVTECKGATPSAERDGGDAAHASSYDCSIVYKSIVGFSEAWPGSGAGADESLLSAGGLLASLPIAVREGANVVVSFRRLE